MLNKCGSFDGNDTAVFLELIKGGYAAYIYTDYIFARGERLKMEDGERSYRTIAVASTIHFPIVFFKKYLSVEVEITSGLVTVTSSEASVCLPIVSDSKADNVAKEREGAIYLPAEYTLSALGIPCESYDNCRLIALGDAELVSRLHTEPRIAFAGENAIFGDYDTDSLTDADFAVAKNKWREKLVGTPKINSLDDEDIKKKIAQLDESVDSALALYNRAPDRIILFGSKPAVDSADLTTQYTLLLRLALAYATYGSKYYNSKEICDAVLDGVEWLYQNLYGEAEIAGTGWRDVHEYNWWDWYVGASERLTDIMLVMEEHFTMEMKERYLRCHRYCCTFMKVGAASRLKTYTKEALLLGDREMLRAEYEDYDTLLDISRPDYVDWTHGIPYNLTYGLIPLSRTLFTGSILSGTRLEFKNPKQYNLFDKLRYCYEPTVYHGMAFQMFRGRANSGSEYSSGAEINAEILPLLGMFGEEEDEYIANYIRRNAKDDELIEKTKQFCSYADLDKLKRILADKAAPQEYVGAYSWFTGDRAAQQRGNYAFGLSLCSEREPNYESINGENKQGWYTNDGALYLYTDRDRHSFDGSNFINCEGVAYKIPGTTVDMRERKKMSIRHGWKMPRAFVGTMSEQGLYIVGTMDYESYNFAGPDQGIADTGYGAGLPLYDNDLVAKKSYFMFDKECVCLGAGITSTMDSQVITTLEHRRALIEEGDTVSVDGELLCGNAYKRVGKAKYIHRDGVGGFILDEPCDTIIERYRDESEKDREFYRETPKVDYDYEHQDYIYAVIDHGKNPKAAKYQYTVLPMASIAETKVYSDAPEVTVLSNTEELQAVRKDILGITFAVFHKAGSIDTAGISVSTDTPCILSVSKMQGRIGLKICDPTHKCDKITLIVNKVLNIIEKSLDVSVETLDNETRITVNTAGAMGAPFELVVSG